VTNSEIVNYTQHCAVSLRQLSSLSLPLQFGELAFIVDTAVPMQNLIILLWCRHDDDDVVNS